RSIRLGGQSAAFLRAALAWAASGATGGGGGREGKEGGPTMYGDFRMAALVSEEVGAQLVLGDRPIDITLSRAWASLSLIERLKLAWGLASLARSRAGGGG
ncbi:unnamed protein product, partial [Discosporangium mesarthrocarpum]